MLADIYDGKIWKSFPDISDVPYFTPETADSHLGVMINLDWFQPFESSVGRFMVLYVTYYVKLDSKKKIC